MTGVLVLVLACFVSGFGAAWLLRAAWLSTRISWSQERMQRKVRYWQDEAIHARDVAEQYIGLLAASTGRDPEPPDWQVTGTG